MSIIQYGQAGLAYGAGFTYGQVNTPVVPPTGKKRMTQLALKLDERDLDGVLALGVAMEEGLKNKPAFAAVDPSPADSAAKRALIATQRAKVEAARAKLAEEEFILDGMDADYRTTVTEMAQSALDEVNGDVAQLEAANIPLRKFEGPSTQPPPEPDNMHASFGDMVGEVDFTWNSGGSRVIFIGEISSVGPTGPWVNVYTGTRSRFTAKGQQPGAEIFARVKQIRNGMHSNWSQIVSHRAR
jgi:hypothetical protein